MNSISKMPFEIRYRNYKMEELELLKKSVNVPVNELSAKLKELADKWKI